MQRGSAVAVRALGCSIISYRDIANQKVKYININMNLENKVEM